MTSTGGGEDERQTFLWTDHVDSRTEELSRFYGPDDDSSDGEECTTNSLVFISIS